MAMLAGPRRKQKVINLRAKNSEWSNDTNKFGQRMLEKMGWSSGKGLGAKENGMVEHVVARYKNDEKGLGFEDKNDQWTKHEDDFNALLANLYNGDNNEEKLHSGVSLEDKSKKSKARVHYHKFTRGKDLTRYSDKDLANIFGKKTLKNQEKTEETQNLDIKSTEQVFTEKGSMEDYFKSKLAALKSKTKLSTDFTIVKEDYDTDYSFRGFSGTFKDSTNQDNIQELSFHNANCEDIDIETNKDENKKKSKKKSRKKTKTEETSTESSSQDHIDSYSENQLGENVYLEPVKKKKSKKRKQEVEDSPVEVEKPKNKTLLTDAVENSIEEHPYVPKKKKKRKNKA